MKRPNTTEETVTVRVYPETRDALIMKKLSVRKETGQSIDNPEMLAAAVRLWMDGTTAEAAAKEASPLTPQELAYLDKCLALLHRPNRVAIIKGIIDLLSSH